MRGVVDGVPELFVARLTTVAGVFVRPGNLAMVGKKKLRTFATVKIRERPAQVCLVNGLTGGGGYTPITQSLDFNDPGY